MRQRLDVGCSLSSSDRSRDIFRGMLCPFRDVLAANTQGLAKFSLLSNNSSSSSV